MCCPVNVSPLSQKKWNKKAVTLRDDKYRSAAVSSRPWACWFIFLSLAVTAVCLSVVLLHRPYWNHGPCKQYFTVELNCLSSFQTFPRLDQLLSSVLSPVVKAILASSHLLPRLSRIPLLPSPEPAGFASSCHSSPFFSFFGPCNLFLLLHGPLTALCSCLCSLNSQPTVSACTIGLHGGRRRKGNQNSDAIVKFHTKY